MLINYFSFNVPFNNSFFKEWWRCPFWCRGGGPAFNFGLIIRRFNPKMMEGPPPTPPPT